MILVWGDPGDPPLGAVLSQLARRGLAHVCVDHRSSIARAWSPDGEAAIVSGGITFDLDRMASAYLRPAGFAGAAGADPALGETLVAWADMTPALIVNRPGRSALNSSKPLQAHAIARAGLRVPETLVTTDPAAVRAFAAEFGEVVYKSISGVRSIVRRLPPSRLHDLDDVATCPTQFQRYIPGRDVRVHVSGDGIHAIEIATEHDDYRYAKAEGVPVSAHDVTLEAGLADRLRRMTRAMGLAVTGIDLRRTPSGEVYCLEVNPSPGFTYYERLAGVDLTTPIVDLLARSTASGSRRACPDRGRTRRGASARPFGRARAADSPRTPGRAAS